MAIADARYKFLYIDVGCNGRVADGGVFNKCSFASAMNAGTLGLPQPSPLRGRTMKLPFVFVADNAFSMPFLPPRILRRNRVTIPTLSTNFAQKLNVHNIKLSKIIYSAPIKRG